MADVEGGYFQVPSDGVDLPPTASGHRFGFHLKTAGALLAGTGLVLFVVATAMISSPTIRSIDTDSTSLFSVARPMRAANSGLNAAPRSSAVLARFPYSVNNMDNRGMVNGQSSLFQPAVQSRSENMRIVPRADFFNKIFRNKDSQYYEETDWQPGDKADYYSKSKGGWIPCTVEEVSDQGVILDVKPGYVVRKREQQLGMRKRFGKKGEPRPDRPL